MENKLESIINEVKKHKSDMFSGGIFEVLTTVIKEPEGMVAVSIKNKTIILLGEDISGCVLFKTKKEIRKMVDWWMVTNCLPNNNIDLRLSKDAIILVNKSNKNLTQHIDAIEQVLSCDKDLFKELLKKFDYKVTVTCS